MIILLEEALYPEKAHLFNELSKGKKLKSDQVALLQLYKDVLCYSPPTERGQMPSYDTPIMIAVNSAHEQAIRLLLIHNTINEETDDLIYGLNPLNRAIEQLKYNPDRRNIFSKIITLLLEKGDYLEPTALNNQSPLMELALVGDSFGHLFSAMLQKTEYLSSDYHGATALSFALQENQARTVMKILDFLGEKHQEPMLNIPRVNGATMTCLLCEFVENKDEGIALLEKMLAMGATLNPENHFDEVTSSLLNPNSDTSLAYVRFLLGKGFNINIEKANDRSITHCFLQYLSVKDEKDKNNYLAIFKLLLEYTASINFIYRALQMPFWQYVKIKDSVVYQLVKAKFNDLPDNMPPQKDRVINKSEEFVNDAFQAAYDSGAESYFNLQKKYAQDWPNGKDNTGFPKDSAAFGRVSTILNGLISLCKNGQLKAEQNLRLIQLLRLFGNKFYILLPVLYNAYLKDALRFFLVTVGDESEKARNLLTKIVEFQKCIQPIQIDEHRNALNERLNYFFYRSMKLILVRGKLIKHDMLIFWIDYLKKCNLLDEKSLAVVDDFAIYNAFLREDKISFDALFAKIVTKLPVDHLLQRQYWYWKIVLCDKKSTDISELIEAVSEGKKHVNETHLYQFNIKIENHLNQKKIELQQQKKKAHPKEVPVQIPQMPTTAVMPPSEEAPLFMKQNGSSSTTKPVLNQSVTVITACATNFNSSVSSNIEKRESKPKRAKIFTRIYEDAIEQAEQIIQGPVNAENDVRKLFHNELRENEILKPLKYKGKFGVFYAVCRTESCNHITGLSKRFESYFTQWDDPIREGASSGIVYEYDTFRLKFGANDYRLHASQHKAEGVNCQLLIFHELWQHDKRLNFTPENNSAKCKV